MNKFLTIAILCIRPFRGEGEANERSIYGPSDDHRNAK